MLFYKYLFIGTALFLVAALCTVYLLVDMYLAMKADAMDKDLSTVVDTLEDG